MQEHNWILEVSYRLASGDTIIQRRDVVRKDMNWVQGILDEMLISYLVVESTGECLHPIAWVCRIE